MSFKKNQKKYNKEVMNTGRTANQYLNNALGLINKYTTDYSGRNDFWLNKLNDRQLNLLSDKYLAQNASMLRGQAAFGTNSATNRQIQDNAYSQQNYLANVANANVKDANSLQQNELSALMNATKSYENPIMRGANAAQNVDAANGAWFNAIGKGMQGAGSVMSAIPVPWVQAVGQGLSATGGIMTGMTSESTSLSPEQMSGINQNTQNMVSSWKDFQNQRNLSTISTPTNLSNYSGITGNFGFRKNLGGF